MRRDKIIEEVGKCLLWRKLRKGCLFELLEKSQEINGIGYLGK